MRGTTSHLVIAIAVMLAGCAGKRAVPPAPLGSAGEAGTAAGEGAPGDGATDDAAALQRALAFAAGSDRVHFAVDIHTLSTEAQHILARQAAWLRDHPMLDFTVEGHCDERGTREYNLALGDRRAQAAAGYLIAQGIDPARIRTLSYGKERPEAPGSDDDAYGLNRRAVSIVVRRP